MIDSKRLIEVMPRLSGNEYKVFVYLLYGYDMARNAYNQAYFERSQSEIKKDTGVKESTLKRTIAKLEEQRLITCERAMKGSIKARTKYYILDYETYTVQNNYSNSVQNKLYIIDNSDIEKETSNKTIFPDLKPLYDRSKQLGDMLGAQTTIEEINRIKDKFIKLWDDGKALYKYEEKYQADKSKNWEAFRKRYDGVKSRINKSTNTHTPKQVDKKDKRESAEMNGGGGARAIADHPLLFSARFKMQYENGSFDPTTLFYFIEKTQERLISCNYEYSNEQLNEVLKDLNPWITWMDESPEMPVSNDSEVSLTQEEWKCYARYLLTGINDRTIKGNIRLWKDGAKQWQEQHRNHYIDCF